MLTEACVDALVEHFGLLSLTNALVEALWLALVGGLDALVEALWHVDADPDGAR